MDTEYELVRELGFYIERRGRVNVVVELSGGCEPATTREMRMWERLTALNEAARRVLRDVDDDGVAEAHDVAIHELRLRTA